MGQVSKALGLGNQFEFKGKTYKVSPWTYEIQAEMEMYLEAEAVEALRRLRKRNVLSEEEFNEQLKETRRDIVNGEYTFGSQAVAIAMRSMKHLKYLMLLQLKPNHPEITPDLVQEIVDDAFDKALEAMSEANADPTNPKSKMKTIPTSETSSSEPGQPTSLQASTASVPS